MTSVDNVFQPTSIETTFRSKSARIFLSIAIETIFWPMTAKILFVDVNWGYFLANVARVCG